MNAENRVSFVNASLRVSAEQGLSQGYKGLVAARLKAHLLRKIENQPWVAYVSVHILLRRKIFFISSEEVSIPS